MSRNSVPRANLAPRGDRFADIPAIGTDSEASTAQQPTTGV